MTTEHLPVAWPSLSSLLTMDSPSLDTTLPHHLLSITLQQITEPIDPGVSPQALRKEGGDSGQPLPQSQGQKGQDFSFGL